MNYFDRLRMAERLKKLRDSQGFTQEELAKILDKYVGSDSKAKGALTLKDVEGGEILWNKGKETISMFESQRKNEEKTKKSKKYGGRIPNPDVFFAYAYIFDTTVDYILGRSDDLRPENRGITEYTGLVNSAIKTLHELRFDIDSAGNKYTRRSDEAEQVYAFVNTFIENRALWDEGGNNIIEIRKLLRDKSDEQADLKIRILKHEIVHMFEQLLNTYVESMKPIRPIPLWDRIEKPGAPKIEIQSAEKKQQYASSAEKSKPSE